MQKRIKDVMTARPITIGPEASLVMAMTVLRDNMVRHLPVVDDTGRLIGIITDRDLRSAVFSPALAEYLSGEAKERMRALGEQLEKLRVKDVMTRCVVTTRSDESIKTAAFLMFEGRFGSLPVVDGDKLVGMITERDVLWALVQTPGETTRAPEHLEQLFG